MKRKVNVWDYAGKIAEAMKPGILVTTKAGEKVNAMTIGWGTLGIEWGRPIFILFVRQSRYTKQMLEKNAEFTINVPIGEADKNILSFCGTKSGRNVDKIAELGLTLEEPTTISVPGIRELPLTLECRVLYQQDQDLSRLDTEVARRAYPDFADFHTAYYAQILDAYIIE